MKTIEIIMTELENLKHREDFRSLLTAYCIENGLEQVEKDYMGIIDLQNNRYYCIGDPSCTIEEIQGQGVSAHPILKEESVDTWEVKVNNIVYFVGNSEEILYSESDSNL